jgi:Family of unknown function (DUF6225)
MSGDKALLDREVRTPWTVRQLRAALADIPDKTPVVVCYAIEEAAGRWLDDHGCRGRRAG